MLVLLSLLWAPVEQDSDDRCRTSKVAFMPRECRDERLLKGAEGLLLLAFSAEMAVKVP